MKPKTCKNCKNKFVPNRPLEQVCSYQCAIELSKVKTKKKLEQDQKAKEKKMKDAVTNWKSKLQTEINKIVRLIDKDLLCLARNKGGQIHAGHIFARGGNQSIKYNLHNIHRQNAQSNHFQNDDGLLREGLIKEYGQDYMNFISELRQTEDLKYKDFEYKAFTEKARKIVLRLNKLDLTYSLQNRILMRNKINLELGIYDEKYCIYDTRQIH